MHSMYSQMRSQSLQTALDKAAALEKQCGCPLLKKERLLEILLAHELFHAVEEQYAGEFLPEQRKLKLWRKPFSNRSVISCLSELRQWHLPDTFRAECFSVYAGRTACIFL